MKLTHEDLVSARVSYYIEFTAEDGFNFLCYQEMADSFGCSVEAVEKACEEACLLEY
jgi:biotin operon repressor